MLGWAARQPRQDQVPERDPAGLARALREARERDTRQRVHYAFRTMEDGQWSEWQVGAMPRGRS